MQKHYSYLDIDVDSKNYRRLNAMQGDIKSRYILVNLYSNNLAYDLSSCTVKIYGLKRDKTIFFNNAVITNEKLGQFEIELTNQALAVAGELKIQILILGTSGEKLTSSAFFIDVGESIIDENAIESANEFNVFTQAMKDFQKWDGKFEEKYDGLEAEYAENITELGSQIKEIENNIDKAVISFVYDDGFIEDDLTYKIFKEYGFKCSFAPIVDNMFANNKNYVDSYREYEEQGFEIMSQSSTHIHFDVEELSSSVLDYEFRKSKENLSDLGFNVNGWVTPYHITLDRYLPDLKKYYDYAFTSKGIGHMNKNTNVYKMWRVSLYTTSLEDIKKSIDECIKERGFLVFYDHRTGYEGSADEDKLREVLDYCKNKINENKLIVDTVKNSVSYFYSLNLRKHDVGISINRNLAPFFNKFNFNSTNGVTFQTKYENENEIANITFSSESSVDSEHTLSFTVLIDDLKKFKSIFSKFNIKSSHDNSFIKTMIQCRFRKSDGSYIRTNSKEIFLNDKENTYSAIFTTDRLTEYTSALITLRFKVKKNITENITITIKEPVIGAGTKLNNIEINDSLLFEGDINSVRVEVLNKSIRNFKNILIVANHNNSSTSSIQTMLIPSHILLVGSAKQRFKFNLQNDNVLEFSFPANNQISLDVVAGTSRIRGIYGIN